MIRKIWMLLAALPLLQTACSDAETAERPAAPSGGGTVEVRIGSGPRIGLRPEAESRTALDDDGVTVRWQTDDRIVLLAADASDALRLEATFSLYHYDATFDEARFAGTIAPMSEGTYTYCALSPEPAAREGLTAHYDIPSVQDGTFRGEYDIMVAKPVEAGALVEGDNSDRVHLQFTHKTHVLRIEIPTSAFTEPITELQLTFPAPVTGRLTVQADDPDAPAVLEGSERTLRLRFAEPRKAGDVVYAAIAPVAFTDADVIEIKALGQTCESEAKTFAGKRFGAGRMTPIRYHVPAVGRTFTQLRFALPADRGASTLGEAVTHVTVTAPEGGDFGEGVTKLEFEPGDEGVHTLVLRPDWTDRISGREAAVRLESASAVIEKPLEIPQIEAYTQKEVAIRVPYLMEERFDTVEEYSDNVDLTGVNDPAAIWIPGLSGWSAARTGGRAGVSVCIVGHREGGMWVPADYEARMDSAPLTAIKEGKTVNVRISFRYSGATNKGAPKMKYGTSEVQGLVNGANADIQHQAGDIAANTTGSYINVDQQITPFTAQATRTTRLSWVAYGDDGIPLKISNYWYYIYIDDVTVSIVP